MKRVLCLALSLCLALTAAGCGGSSSQTLAGAAAAGGLSGGQESLEEAGAQNKGWSFTLPGQSSQSGRQLVADPLEEEAVAARQPGEFMALESYGTGLNVGKESTSAGQKVRSFKGNKSCYEALESYVELLCSDYGFRQEGEPYYKVIGGDLFFDFCLVYTGENAPASHKVTGTFSKTLCDLSLYGTTQGSTLKGALWFDPSLTGLDGGYRYGQEGADTTPVGESALAGLWREANGSFSTSDGRLTAAVGTATLLWDGEASTASASYLRYTDEERQEMVLTSSAGRLARVYLPFSCELTGGRVLGQEQFIIESSYAVSAGGLFEDEPSYTWPSMFAVRRQEGWVVPVLGMSGSMTALWTRVMYADEDTVVIYAAAEFDTAPYSLELLAAMSTAGSEVDSQPSTGGGGSGSCSYCGGTGDCTTCGGTGKVRKALAGTGKWVEQDCTACRPTGSGNCPFCGGDGKA